jgi:ankyrin repeat protein
MHIFQYIYIALTFLAFAIAGPSRENCVEEPNKAKPNPLIAASLKGDAVKVECLLGKGAKVNYQGLNGNTALIWTSLRGHRKSLAVLLSAGMIIFALNYFDGDNNGFTMYRASRGEHKLTK